MQDEASIIVLKWSNTPAVWEIILTKIGST